MIGDARVALIAARTKEPKPTKLASEKAKIAAGSNDAAETVADGSDLAGVLEALRSVIPTAIAGVYTAAVVVSRGVAQTQGASDRTEVQAKLARSGQSEDAIKKVLERLPDESKHLVSLRWLVFGVAIAAVLVATLRAAEAAKKRKKKNRFPAAELAVAEVAFVGWALAMPGTPLAAYHSASNLLALTVTIAGCAGLVVASMGKLVLTKPQA